MGCDIHLIAQIKKDGEWEYIPEKPESLTDRNYTTFAVLAQVRSDFNTKGFAPKGLPKDLKTFLYDFKSESEKAKERYENAGSMMFVSNDGKTILKTYDTKLKRILSEDEYNEFRKGPCDVSRYLGLGCTCSGNKYEYYVSDAAILNGVFKEIPYKQQYKSYNSFMDDLYEDDWDENAQDYGYWKTNFKCEDYHSHSYLSLQELLEFDTVDYEKSKVKVPKVFYDEFVKRGGKFPEGMEVEEYEPEDMIAALRNAFNPDIIVSFEKESVSELPIFKSIAELKAIAKQYCINDYNNIRIVFAFDN